MTLPNQTMDKLISELNELREENQKLKILTYKDALAMNENSLTGVYIVKNNQFKYVNQSLCEMFGYYREELIGQNPAIVIHPEDHSLFLEKIRKRQSGEIDSIKYEVLGCCKNGEIKNILILGGITRINGNLVPIGNMLDVTESRNNEKKLVKSNRLYSVISRVSQAIIRIKEKDRLFAEICKIVVEIGKFNMAWIGLIDNETQIVKPTTYAGNENGYLSIMKAISVSDNPEGRGPTGSAIRSGNYFVCSDFNTDPFFEPWRSEAVKRGYRSSIALPIKQLSEVIGAITIYSADTNFFDEPEIRLLQDVVGNINFALDAIELELRNRLATEKIENNEKQLRMVFENMTSGFLLFEVLFDKNGNPVDHRLIDINAAVERQIKATQNEQFGKISKELFFKIPPEITSQLYQVAITGNPLHYERFNESMGRFYGIRAFSPQKGQFALLLDDITERKQIEEQLLQSKALLRSVVDSSKDLVWIVDADNLSLLDWNPMFEKYTSERGLLIKKGDAIEDFFPGGAASIEQWVQYYKKAKELGSYTVDHRSLVTDQPFLVTINLLKQGDNVFGISTFAKDISEMKAIEAESAKNKQHFQTMFEHAPLGMALVDSFTGQFYEVNDKFAQINLKTKDELTSMRWYQLPDPNDVSSDKEDMIRINSGEIAGFSKEKLYNRPDGTTIWIKITIVPIKNNDGKHSMHLCMVEDITERKTNEEQIAIFSQAVEQSHASIVLTNPKGIIEYVNPEFCQVSGYTRQEAMGQNPRILKSEQTSPEDYKDMWETITSGKEWTGEFINKKKNGESYIEHASITPITNNKGQITHFIAIKEDITELKKAATEIVTLSAVVEENPLMVLITNEKYEIQYANKQFFDFTEYVKEDIMGRTAWVFNPKHWDNEIYQGLLGTVNKGEVWQAESVNRKKDGNAFFEKVKVFPLVDKKRKATNYIIIAEDVTEEKQIINDLINAKEQAEKSESDLRKAQNEILRNEKLLQEVETISKVGGWEYIVKTKQSYWTPEVYRIYDLEPNSVTDHFNLSLNYFLPDDIILVTAAFIRCLQEGIGYDLEFQITTGLGNKKWVRAKAEPILENNKVVRIIGSLGDISAQKRIEKEINDAKKNIEENELRLRLAIDAGHFGIWDWDTGRSAIVWNDRMYEFYEADATNFDLTISKNWQKKIHPDDLPFVLDKLKSDLPNKGKARYSYRIMLSNGDARHLETQANVIKGIDGNILRVIGVVKDITERKLAEIALQESEERYRNLFQRSRAVLLLLDAGTGAIVEANPAACSYYGWSKAQLLNMKINEINMLTDEQIKNEMELAVREKRNYFVFKHRLANGTTRFVEVYSSPLTLTGRKLLYSIIHDITDRKKAEEDLVVAKAKAEESDRLKTAFLANMSHEIRTPLNSIIGFSDLLLDPFFNKEQQSEFVNIIKQNGNNLQTIVSDIMDIAQIESGLIVVRNEAFFLGKLVDNIACEQSLICKQKGLELKLNKHISDIRMDCDEGRIKQILTNLVGNAIKFTEKGHIELGYKLTEDNMIQFFVKDTGIGIPEEYHEKIFERFYQVDSSYTRKYGGNGLGLTITKQLVELLGGEIWLESEVDKGASFYVDFYRNLREG
jgi:PAS domain S-box-containing protein